MAARGPWRDGLIVAAIVAAAYLAFFVFQAAGGEEVALDHAVAQVAFQTVGLGLLATVVSWLIRRYV